MFWWNHSNKFSMLCIKRIRVHWIRIENYLFLIFNNDYNSYILNSVCSSLDCSSARSIDLCDYPHTILNFDSDLYVFTVT